MAEIPDYLVERWIAAQEHTATSLGQSVELQREQNATLGRLLGVMSSSERAMLSLIEDSAKGRLAAVLEVKEHVTATVQKGDRWWKTFALVLGLLLLLAQVFGDAWSAFHRISSP